LFDLKKDPLEMNDLSEKPEYASKVKEMFDDLLKLQKSMDDDLDLKPLYRKVITG